eukprot:scaffold861_cov231-Chaetoceros_neogracile.AAC.7
MLAGTFPSCEITNKRKYEVDSAYEMEYDISQSWLNQLIKVRRRLFGGRCTADRGLKIGVGNKGKQT